MTRHKLLAAGIAALLVTTLPAADISLGGSEAGEVPRLLLAQQDQNQQGGGGPQTEREQEQEQGGTTNQNQNQNQNQNRDGDDGDDDNGPPVISLETARSLPAYACFFAESDMRGDVICFSDGGIVRELEDDWDDRISSLEIVGTTVTVCTDEDLEGTCADFDQGVRLPATLNDAVSSFRIGR